MARSTIALVALLALGGLGVLVVAGPGEVPRVAAMLVGQQTVVLGPGDEAARDARPVRVADARGIRTALERSVAPAPAREAALPAPVVARASLEAPEPPVLVPVARVLVLDDAHRTCAGLSVGLYSSAECRDAEATSLTDSAGVAMLELDEESLAQEWRGSKRAWIAIHGLLEDRERVEIDLGRPPRETVVLRVGAFGAMRIRLDRRRIEAKDLLAKLSWLPKERCWPQVKVGGAILSRVEGSQLDLRCAELGRVLRLSLYAQDYAYAADFELAGPTRPGKTIEYDLVLEPVAPRYLVRLIDPSGLPLAEAEVEVEWEGRFWTEAVTDAGGTLAWSGCMFEGPGEEVDLRIRTIERDLEGHRRIVAGSAGDVADLGDLALVAPRPIVAGRVLASDGRPVHGAHLTLRAEEGPDSPGASTDDDGRFEFRGTVPDGPSSIDVRADGHLPLDGVAVERGAMDLELRLETAGGLLGWVMLDEEFANLRLDVDLVDLVAADGRQVSSTWRSSRYWEDGFEFRFPSLPAGRATVSISLPGEAEPLVLVPDVKIPLGELSRDRRLQGIDLTGKLHRHVIELRDARGVAVSGAWTLHRAHGSDGEWASTYANDGDSVVVSRHADLDLRAGAPGFRTAGVESVSGSARVVLEKGLAVVLELDPVVELQEGESFGLEVLPAWLDEDEVHELTFDVPNLWLDGVRSGRAAVPEPGEYRLRWWHPGSDEPLPDASAPIRIADDPREQTFTVAPDAEALRRAREIWAEGL